MAADEGDYGAHIASHLDQRTYKCSKCDYTAIKQSSVLHHIQSCHDETEDIEVIDMETECIEEAKLVNFDPVLKLSPVSDLDLDKEGLILYTPPLTPLTPVFNDEDAVFTMETGETRIEEEDAVTGLDSSSVKDLENDEDRGSNATEEFGITDDDDDETSSPEDLNAKTTSLSILRATLQGKLPDYGFERVALAQAEKSASLSSEDMLITKKKFMSAAASSTKKIPVEDSDSVQIEGLEPQSEEVHELLNQDSSSQPLMADTELHEEVASSGVDSDTSNVSELNIATQGDDIGV